MGNRPRWMAGGLLLISLALLLCTSMNFIFPPPNLSETHFGGNSTSQGNAVAAKMICKNNNTYDTISTNNSTVPLHNLLVTNCQEDSSHRKWAFAAWVLIYSLLGMYLLYQHAL